LATVVFTVRSGKDPGRVSSPVTGDVQDVSSTGMSVVTPRLAPDGIHIMYDTLMTFDENRKLIPYVRYVIANRKTLIVG